MKKKEYKFSYKELKSSLLDILKKVKKDKRIKGKK
jgi:hypothetical protein